MLPRETDIRRAYVQDTDSDLFDSLVEWHQRASKLPSLSHYQLVALFVLHTWLADLVDYSPYLCFESRDPERGKTRTGQAIAWVSYRGIHTETLQEANLFRWSDSLQATIFFDVRDLWKKAEKRGSDDILLGRFQRNGPKVARVLDPQAGAFKGVTYFDCYGATILAINETLREPLKSRTIGIVPPEASGKYPTMRETDALTLKARGAAFRARHLLHPIPEVDKPADGRLGDIMQPLAMMASIVGGDLPNVFPSIVRIFRRDRMAERAETFEARIIGAVQRAVSDGHMVEGILPTSAVLPILNEGLPEDRQFTVQRLGVRLRNLGFPDGKVPGSDGLRGRRIDLDQLDALKRKYGLSGDDDDDVENPNGHEPPEPPEPPGARLAHAQGDFRATERVEDDNSGRDVQAALKPPSHNATPSGATGATGASDVHGCTCGKPASKAISGPLCPTCNKDFWCAECGGCRKCRSKAQVTPSC